MSRTLTALKVTPGITYTVPRDGSPYRADESGIIHVEAAHVAPLTAMAAPTGGAQPALATLTDVVNGKRSGVALSITAENYKDRG